MNHSIDQPFNFHRLGSLLRTLRRRKRLSVNQLAKLTGISRRTLERIEKRNSKSEIRRGGLHESQVTSHQSRQAGVSARTAYRLAKALLGEEETERRMEDQTRLSRSLGNDPLYKFLDDLYHFPAFLFHDSPEQRALRAEFGDDYRHSLDLLLRSGFGTRNLGARLRAFRMQHDLTLIETAALLDLSKSELHRLERAERRPSPRTRYRILRLLTLPLAGHDFSRADSMSFLSLGEKAAASLGRQQPGRAGNADREPAARRASSEGSQACPEQGRGGNPRRVSPPPHSRSRSADHGARVAALKALLAQPPPKPDARSSEPDPLAHLRHAWLAGSLKTKELAAAVGVSPPHLIRLLRRDLRPSRKLCEQLAALTSRL